MRAARGLALSVLFLALFPGCGGQARNLGDGGWYGTLASVDVAHRRLELVPACRLDEAGRWAAVADQARAAVVLARNPELEIYERPTGNAASGHGQSVDLRRLAGAVAHHGAGSRPGWFVTVRGGAAVSVVEDSGIRASGDAEKRAFACVRDASAKPDSAALRVSRNRS